MTYEEVKPLFGLRVLVAFAGGNPEPREGVIMEEREGVLVRVELRGETKIVMPRDIASVRLF